MSCSSLLFQGAGLQLRQLENRCSRSIVPHAPPDGDNILNPKQTLKQKDLEANDIRTAEAIVKKMRNPGPVPTHPQEWAGMKMFDKNKISDEDALKIAEYIMKTFH